MPSSRPAEARAVADGHYDEVQGQLSPDERWLAYTSDESGAPEVYLMSLRMGGRKKAASSHGPEEAEEHGANFSYPPDAGQGGHSTNKSGTEIFLAVGRRGPRRFQRR